MGEGDQQPARARERVGHFASTVGKRAEDEGSPSTYHCTFTEMYVRNCLNPKGRPYRRSRGPETPAELDITDNGAQTREEAPHRRARLELSDVIATTATTLSATPHVCVRCGTACLADASPVVYTGKARDSATAPRSVWPEADWRSTPRRGTVLPH